MGERQEPLPEEVITGLRCPATFTNINRDARGGAVTGARIRLREARVYRRLMRMRFPFRFGNATITEAPVVYARVFLQSESGAMHEGVGASGSSPLWFDKRAGRSIEEKEGDLLRALAKAIDAYANSGFGTAWELHCAAAETVRKELVAQGMTPLAAGFGARSSMPA